MTSSPIRFAAKAILFLVLTACPDTRPTPETFCRDFTIAYTDFRVRCGELSASGGEDLKYLASGTTCQVDKRLTFDRDRAKQCLAEIAKLECGTRRFPFEDPPVAEGTLAAGDSCFDGECARGLYCDRSSSCPGHCEPRVAVGAPAVGPCVSEAWPLEGVCAQRVPVGESCAALPSLERPACVRGAVCGGADLCIEDHGAGAGEYCNADEGLFCGYGLQCLGDGCEPLSGPGERCGPLRSCQWDLSCLRETCVSAFGEGEECTVVSDCRAPFTCIGSREDGVFRCTKRLASGATCALGGSQCAAGLACVGPFTVERQPQGDVLLGKCGPPLARGASCETLNDEEPCEDGLYCGARESCVDQKTSGKCSSSRECRSGFCQVDGGCLEWCIPPAP